MVMALSGSPDYEFLGSSLEEIKREGNILGRIGAFFSL